MAVAVGEEVSPDVVRHFRTLSSERLSQIRGAGISDQRVALIGRILAERRPGARVAPEKELLKALVEPVTVAEFRARGTREAFKEAGLKPIFEGGELVGVSDLRRQMSMGLHHIGDIGQKRLEILERGGIIRFEEEKISFMPPPPLVFEAAPTFTEQLRGTIEESTPDIPFIPKDIEKLIGQIGGLEKFTRGKVTDLIFSARDIEGRRIFNLEQATGIADITVEVVEGYGTGLVAGKAFTLARGGFLAALPKTLKTGSKFKNVIKIADITILAGLGALEARRIAEINEREGTEAAVIEMIGLVSFGKGFSKAGLRANPQAEAEFKNFVKKIRDFSIKGKRGETTIFRRKKDSVLRQLEEFAQSDVERAEALVGQLEKKLLKQKTLKDQLKILAEIKNRLKTSEAKKGFDELIASLLEKDILKLPKIEIIPGVKARIPPLPTPPPKPTIKLPLSTSALRNQERVKANLEKNRVRIEQSKMTLGERIKERNFKVKEINEKIDLMNKQIVTQKEKITNLVKQKADQKTIAKERQKLALMLKNRLATAQPQIFATSQRILQRQVERQRLLLKQRQQARLKLRQLLRAKPGVLSKLRFRPKFKFPLIIPPFLLKKVPKKKKKVKKKPKVEDMFEVFVRRRGKDISIGTRKTAPKARRFLKKRLATTLRASGFITDPTGQKLKPKVTKGFRVAKRDPLRLVEKRGRRLDTSSETGAIQKARREAPPKIKSSSMIKLKKK